MGGVAGVAGTAFAGRFGPLPAGVAGAAFPGPFAAVPFGAAPVPAFDLTAPGLTTAEAPASAARIIAKREAESDPESESDAEAQFGPGLLVSRLGAAPVAGPVPVALGPAPV